MEYFIKLLFKTNNAGAVRSESELTDQDVSVQTAAKYQCHFLGNSPEFEKNNSSFGKLTDSFTVIYWSYVMTYYSSPLLNETH